MRDRWPAAAPSFNSAVGEIVFVSKLLGADASVVLHGGGNTSIKDRVEDVTGGEVDVLWVKGSGWDLATIEPDGFTPLRLDRLRKLLTLEKLSDLEMMNQLRQSSLRSSCPDPSVESLIHALLPARVVLHSHADAIIALTNQVDGEALVERLFGDDTVVLPYVMPGFDLARLAVQRWETRPDRDVLGLFLHHHGLFTVGRTAEEAYSRHVELVSRAESEWSRIEAGEDTPTPQALDRVETADLRRRLSEAAGAPVVLRHSPASRATLFALDPEVATVATRGPATPDHVIRTKRVPMIGRDVDAYQREYAVYFEAHRRRRGVDLAPLDSAPRVILDGERGMSTVGRSARDALIAEEIYLHTIDIIHAAEKGSGYRALPAADIFDVEYWELEQAKLRLGSTGDRRFTGEVAVVTGAASGIGRACAAALLAEGAAVVGLDLSETVEVAFDSPSWLGVTADVADSTALSTALDKAVTAFGGVDMVVPAAGIFATSAPLGERDDAAWLRSLEVNATSVARLFGLVHPLLVRAPRGGRVVLIATKNIAAPGPGASAYSASKAAAAQVARIAALEWASDGIRVNLVHPDAVFDTGLWNDRLLSERAAKYGMSVADYKRRNLLGLEIASADVARAIVALCSDDFRATTGANIPVDGGNERVI